MQETKLANAGIRADRYLLALLLLLLVLLHLLLQLLLHTAWIHSVPPGSVATPALLLLIVLLLAALVTQGL